MRLPQTIGSTKLEALSGQLQKFWLALSNRIFLAAPMAQGPGQVVINLCPLCGSPAYPATLTTFLLRLKAAVEAEPAESFLP